MKSLDWEFYIYILYNNLRLKSIHAGKNLLFLPGSLLHGKFGSRDGGDPNFHDFLWSDWSDTVDGRNPKQPPGM